MGNKSTDFSETYYNMYDNIKSGCSKIETDKYGKETGYWDDGSFYIKGVDGKISLYFPERSHPYSIIKSNGERCDYYSEEHCAIAGIYNEKGDHIEINSGVIRSVADSQLNILRYDPDGNVETFTDAQGNRLSFSENGNIDTYTMHIERDGAYLGAATYNKDGELCAVEDDKGRKYFFSNGKLFNSYNLNCPKEILDILQLKDPTAEKMARDRAAVDRLVNGSSREDGAAAIQQAIQQAKQNAERLDKLRAEMSPSMKPSDNVLEQWRTEWNKADLNNKANLTYTLALSNDRVR